jgi:hypothetical protein
LIDKGGPWGLAAAGAYVSAAVLSHFLRRRPTGD